MRALIMVDIQNDFCEGGSLGIENSNSIIPFVNGIQEKYDIVVTTQDFHPANHKSFASNNEGKNVNDMILLNGIDQRMWKDHCVQGTKGADFHKDLKTKDAKNFVKGTNSEVDSYSGFLDNDKKSKTGLADFLIKQGVSEVDVVGLALDYCVKATAIDAKNLGLKVRVLLDGTKAVNIEPNHGDQAILELTSLGIECL